MHVERRYGLWYDTSVHSYVRLMSGGTAILARFMMLPAPVRRAAGLSGSQVEYLT